MSENLQPTERSQVIHGKILQRIIGVLGMAFPFVLALGTKAFGCKEIQPSISYYYHTAMGEVFIGFLCAFAMFLFAYTGYDKRDARAGTLAGIFAIGVALIPTAFGAFETCCTKTPWFTVEVVHLSFAISFFLVLTYFSLFLFTRTKDPAQMTSAKKRRNSVYKICGVTMLICMTVIALYMLFLKESYPYLQDLKPVFWLEAAALFAFGISWLTKGETIFRD
jgi:hypothetical protein